MAFHQGLSLITQFIITKKEGQLSIRMHMGEYIEAEIEYMATCLSTKYNVETIYKL